MYAGWTHRSNVGDEIVVVQPTLQDDAQLQEEMLQRRARLLAKQQQFKQRVSAAASLSEATSGKSRSPIQEQAAEEPDYFADMTPQVISAPIVKLESPSQDRAPTLHNVARASLESMEALSGEWELDAEDWSNL